MVENDGGTLPPAQPPPSNSILGMSITCNLQETVRPFSLKTFNTNTDAGDYLNGQKLSQFHLGSFHLLANASLDYKTMIIIKHVD